MDFLDLLVLEGCDLNQVTCSVPLHLACHMGNLQLVEYLLNCGADMTIEKGMCYPDPHIPVRHVPSRFHFLETDIFTCDSNHQLPLMYAVTGDHVEIVKRLLQGSKGPDTNWPYHRLPLHEAAQHGAGRTLQHLLQIKPSEVNTLSDAGFSPLLHGIQWGKKFVQPMVEAGADMHVLTTKRQTALHLLYQNIKDPLELYETTKFLLGAGLEQDINVVDKRRCSAVHELLSLVNRRVSSFACKQEDSEQMRFDKQVLDSMHLLLTYNCDPNLVNTSSVTVLHKLILLHDYTTSNDTTGIALETLTDREAYKVDFELFHEALVMLLEHGVEVNRGTSAGRTPLVMLLQSTLNVDPSHIATYAAGYLRCITTLCNYGAKPSYSPHTHIAMVTTLFKFGQKCLAERDPTIQQNMSEFVQDVLASLLQHGLDSNHCSSGLQKHRTGNILTEMVRLCGHIRHPADLVHIHQWVLTALQWGANPDMEPYPSDPIIVQSQSSIFLKPKGSQPVHHYMYHIQDINSLFEGGHAERLLLLFYNSMDHVPLYQCLSAAKIMSRFDPDRTPTYGFMKMVSGLSSQPRSLKQIARVTIYKAMHRQLMVRTHDLPLPGALQRYIVNVE